ncbi:hypothetical protein FHT78_005134 [Rhizobium sp. BK196]|jgi:hypothetical protein|nr:MULTISPECIES: hypothetical protein [unclassified Rhizobium]MBB3313342.1 hypothetical protein [Rhizobium sp. BK196]MBB3464461.1 hypothetical protein [Rhizobium sp. BK377]
MRHNDQIVLPYVVHDTFSNISTIKISDLLKTLDAEVRVRQP